MIKYRKMIVAISALLLLAPEIGNISVNSLNNTNVVIAASKRKYRGWTGVKKHCGEIADGEIVKVYRVFRKHGKKYYSLGKYGSYPASRFTKIYKSPDTAYRVLGKWQRNH